MTTDRTTLAKAVAAITAEAGQQALRRQSQDFRRWEKSPGEPVSEVDLEIDTLLHDRLTALLPDAAWLSEETTDNSERLAVPRLWVVDPIDGTRDFLRGRKGWAVSVALVEHGWPVIGVLAEPARNLLWHAEAGKGAWCNGESLRVASCNRLAGARVPADSLMKVDRDLVMVAKPNSIALRIAMVAAGEADLVATLRWSHEWDIAAAMLLAREAGAVVSDAFGAPLAFNTRKAEAFGMVVSGPGIHAAAVERLRERAEKAVAR